MSVVRLLGDGYNEPVDGHDVGAESLIEKVHEEYGGECHPTQMLDGFTAYGWALVQVGLSPAARAMREGADDA